MLNYKDITINTMIIKQKLYGKKESYIFTASRRFILRIKDTIRLDLHEKRGKSFEMLKIIAVMPKAMFFNWYCCCLTISFTEQIITKKSAIDSITFKERFFLNVNIDTFSISDVRQRSLGDIPENVTAWETNSCENNEHFKICYWNAGFNRQYFTEY